MGGRFRWVEGCMADWVVAVGGDRFQGERLYQADAVEAAVPEGVGVAEDAGVGGVFGLGGVAGAVRGGVAEVAYTHRMVDRLVPAADVGLAVPAAGGLAAVGAKEM